MITKHKYKKVLMTGIQSPRARKNAKLNFQSVTNSQINKASRFDCISYSFKAQSALKDIQMTVDERIIRKQ